jgi:hypothetical protein
VKAVSLSSNLRGFGNYVVLNLLAAWQQMRDLCHCLAMVALAMTWAVTALVAIHKILNAFVIGDFRHDATRRLFESIDREGANLLATILDLHLYWLHGKIPFVLRVSISLRLDPGEIGAFLL